MTLFNAGFVSCWSELSPEYREEIIGAFEAAIGDPTVPAEILQQLLNVAEFMDRDGKGLPIDVRRLVRIPFCGPWLSARCRLEFGGDCLRFIYVLTLFLPTFFSPLYRVLGRAGRAVSRLRQGAALQGDRVPRQPERYRRPRVAHSHQQRPAGVPNWREVERKGGGGGGVLLTLGVQ